jgi:ElaB/YqjD/DUF883 family membrane-anchored ribosome-binding protein
MTDADQDESSSKNLQSKNETFVLSKGWVLVGVLATLLGIVAGLIMSSATFAR